jgi:hypothetical protein
VSGVGVESVEDGSNRLESARPVGQKKAATAPREAGASTMIGGVCTLDAHSSACCLA